MYSGSSQGRLVFISTGVIAPKSANSDLALEIGEAVAQYLVGNNFSEVKLKRNDMVVFIGSSLNSVAKTKHCDRSLSAVPQTHLHHQKATGNGNALFENGVMMLKKNKNVLVAILKSLVEPIADDELDNPLYIVDVGIFCIVSHGQQTQHTEMLLHTI